MFRPAAPVTVTTKSLPETAAVIAQADVPLSCWSDSTVGVPTSSAPRVSRWAVMRPSIVLTAPFPASTAISVRVAR
mgnify:CR=1 FL=1